MAAFMSMVFPLLALWTTLAAGSAPGKEATATIDASGGVNVKQQPLSLLQSKRNTVTVDVDTKEAEGFDCKDDEDGPADRFGDDCLEYQHFSQWCGKYDDGDFSSETMCCACKAAAQVAYPDCYGGYGYGCPPLPPTEEPTAPPTEEPTAAPTEDPTAAPTEDPTPSPTPSPTEEPTAPPTEEPTAAPTEDPTAAPTEDPTPSPTPSPTEEPTPACAESCAADNTINWGAKCTWNECAGCAECTDMCKSTCIEKTPTWETKCGWDNCRACAQCAGPMCKESCAENTREWSVKCDWDNCGGCSECN